MSWYYNRCNMISNKDIIDKYTFLLMEYIHLINTSDIINSLEKSNVIFLTGLNTLIHIYKMSLFISKNVDTASSYTQKGVYCYLEYIEQMYKTNYINHLDYLDAITFVYNKTIVEIYGPQNNSESTSIINVLSLSEIHPPHPTEMEEQKKLLTQIEKITNTLLWTNNPDLTFENRLDISYRFLQKYLNSILLFENGEDGHSIISFIVCVQDHICIDYDEYIEILYEFHKQMKKYAKYHTAQLKENIHTKLMYLVAHMTGKTFTQIAEMEGFKKKMDIVKWFFALSG